MITLTDKCKPVGGIVRRLSFPIKSDLSLIQAVYMKIRMMQPQSSIT